MTVPNSTSQSSCVRPYGMTIVSPVPMIDEVAFNQRYGVPRLALRAATAFARTSGGAFSEMWL